MKKSDHSRSFDVVVFGATGYVGRLLSQHLARRARRDLRWALAGRDLVRLEHARRELARSHPDLRSLPMVIADADDPGSLEALASRARVIATTVGPYHRRGAALVRACARQGTDYCDIAGELPFIAASIAENDAIAKAHRSRVVHACGFDALPFDLGVYMLWRHARQQHGESLAWAKSFVKFKGRGSPGGLETVLDQSQRHRRPFAHSGVRFDPDLGAWTAPFMMSALNTSIVCRSSELLGYGDAFQYREALHGGGGPQGLAKAAALCAGQVGLAHALSLSWTHPLVRRAATISRGTGFFEVQMIAETEAGRRLLACARGDGDPGCQATAIMLAESALCLADDPRPEMVGVVTPALALGERILPRLRDAGMPIDLQ